MTADENVPYRKPCRSGHTDCTMDCGWCKGTGYETAAAGATSRRDGWALDPQSAPAPAAASTTAGKEGSTDA